MVVQSFFFKRYLPIGNLKTAIEFFVDWDVDEIIMLDIDASKKGYKPRFDLIESVSKKCFVPLTIGGGISTIDDIRDVLNAGADKISINTAAIQNPEFIEQARNKMGSQGVTVSVDAKWQKETNQYEVMIGSGKIKTGLNTAEWCHKAEKLGAGEIFINSVDRDGSRKGYDIDLLKTVSNSVQIPVIACGGVGRVNHLSEAITQGGCQAVSAANIFQHTEHSTIAAKAHLKYVGIDIRISTQVKYESFQFDHLGRPL